MAEKLPDLVIGRDNTTQQVSFFRVNMDHSNKKVPVLVGALPKNAVMTNVSAYTKTALSETKVQLGTKPGGKEICELEVKAIGVKSHTFTEDKMFVPKDSEVTLYATLDKDTATAGEFVLVVEFVTDK